MGFCSGRRPTQFHEAQPATFLCFFFFFFFSFNNEQATGTKLSVSCQLFRKKRTMLLATFSENGKYLGLSLQLGAPDKQTITHFLQQRTSIHGKQSW